MDPDLGVDPDPPWIRIHMIPILALLNVIPAPDPDPQKSGVVTPLVGGRQFCITGIQALTRGAYYRATR